MTHNETVLVGRPISHKWLYPARIFAVQYYRRGKHPDERPVDRIVRPVNHHLKDVKRLCVFKLSAVQLGMSNASKVALAVEPLRSAALERAAKFARDYAGLMTEKFLADPSLAEYPKGTGHMSRAQYAVAMNTYHVVSSLTMADPAHIPANCLEKQRRVVSPAGLERFVTSAVADADVAYSAFIAKLEEKIGDCDAATLTGEHVWGYSVLTAVKGDVVESWRTHQIVNVSKLRKVFNQWPTRKLARKLNRK
jgi:hypothetical protein